MSKTYKWQYRKHLLKLLCNYLRIRLRSNNLICGQDGFFYEIVQYNGNSLEVMDGNSKRMIRDALSNPEPFLHERDAINDLFKFLTKVIKVGKIMSNYSVSQINWIQFTNEDDLKLQLVLAGAWKEMEVSD